MQQVAKQPADSTKSSSRTVSDAVPLKTQALLPDDWLKVNDQLLDK